jgi:hypothetical protein
MILEFVRQQNTTGYVPNMNIEEISQAIGTDELGTPLQGIEKINEKLLRTLKSMEIELSGNFVERRRQSDKWRSQLSEPLGFSFAFLTFLICDVVCQVRESQ